MPEETLCTHSAQKIPAQRRETQRCVFKRRFSSKLQQVMKDCWSDWFRRSHHCAVRQSSRVHSTFKLEKQKKSWVFFKYCFLYFIRLYNCHFFLISSFLSKNYNLFDPCWSNYFRKLLFAISSFSICFSFISPGIFVI